MPLTLSRGERGLKRRLRKGSLSLWERVGVRVVNLVTNVNRATIWRCSRILRQSHLACQFE
jgi:hypothetical protein